MNETEFERLTAALDRLVIDLRGEARDEMEHAVETIRAIHWNSPLIILRSYD